MSKGSLNNIAQSIEVIASQYLCIKRIGIFGSYARGDYDETSDIDILYDYNPKADEATHQFLSFVEDFLDKIKPMEADFIYINNLLEKDDDFKKNALADVKWLYQA